MTGQPLPPDVDGIDMLPALTKGAALPERAILLGKDTAVRGDWKLKGGELFDLAKDPGEKNNVAAANQEIVTRLRADVSRFKEIEGPKFTSSLPEPGQWPPNEWKLPEENPR
jgi:arylsulfatase B